MSLAIVYSRASCGIKSPLVNVETHISNGLPSFSIVGLADTAVKESKERVRSALLNANFEFPAKRITVNLAPADLPKDGGRFDLAIAIGILAASGQIPLAPLSEYEFCAELALSGELRPVNGILPFAIQTRNANRHLFIASSNLSEATLVKDITILSAEHILQICAHFTGQQLLTPVSSHTVTKLPTEPDLVDVKGQPRARRVLEIAAAGGHSLLMTGPPGTGKTMLASRIPGILPDLNDEQALAIAAIASLSTQGFDIKQWSRRPFRAPHHTASSPALVGGSSPPRPGEISLAHHGILFLDELPEFNRKVLETLREPMETGHITISRAGYQTLFPAQFQLIAAMNPCPCGYLTDPNRDCSCTSNQIQRYRAKLSGPILDRIDIHIEVPSLSNKALLSQASAQVESSAIVKQRVVAAHTRQLARAGKSNVQLNNQEVHRYCQLNKSDQELLEQAMQQLNLSARAFYRILRVARTIADLEGTEQINTSQLTEALSYRNLEKPQQTATKALTYAAKLRSV